jgi:hypothetical protein
MSSQMSFISGFLKILDILGAGNASPLPILGHARTVGNRHCLFPDSRRLRGPTSNVQFSFYFQNSLYSIVPGNDFLILKKSEMCFF